MLLTSCQNFPPVADLFVKSLVQWAVIGGFCLALAGSVVTAIAFVITQKVTQRDHARRLGSLESALQQFLTRMETLERGMAVLLQRSGRSARSRHRLPPNAGGPVAGII